VKRRRREGAQKAGKSFLFSFLFSFSFLFFFFFFSFSFFYFSFLFLFFSFFLFLFSFLSSSFFPFVLPCKPTMPGKPVAKVQLTVSCQSPSPSPSPSPSLHIYLLFFFPCSSFASESSFLSPQETSKIVMYFQSPILNFSLTFFQSLHNGSILEDQKLYGSLLCIFSPYLSFSSISIYLSIYLSIFLSLLLLSLRSGCFLKSRTFPLLFFCECELKIQLSSPSPSQG